MIAEDLEKIIHQEKLLQFTSFNEDVAWEIGSAIYERAVTKQLPIVIQIGKFGASHFFASRPGVTLDNHDWIKRKANTVQRFLRSSYRINHELALQKQDIQQRYHLDPSVYTSAGGGFPVFVKGVGVIGCIVVSGLPERQDHQIIIEVLCDYLGQNKDELMLSDKNCL